MKTMLAVILFVLSSGVALSQTQPDFVKSKDRVVKVMSKVVNSTQIQVHWAEERHATSFTVARKLFGNNASPWTPLAGANPLPGTATSFTDTTVTSGVRYEYRVTKNATATVPVYPHTDPPTTTTVTYTAYGYTAAGIAIPPTDHHFRGKLILVYPDTPATTPTQLFKDALIGDGWMLESIPLTTAQNTDVTVVKGLIQAKYNLDVSNTKGVLLLGHVAVPYSGLYSSGSNPQSNPPADGHLEHGGAWPADAYYGDMNATAANWPDSGTFTKTQNPNYVYEQRHSNSPGDKKWDTQAMTGEIELQVGRVDFANVAGSAYGIPGKTEADLMLRYFQKNVNYRRGITTISKGAAIADYWQDINDYDPDPAGYNQHQPAPLNANTSLSATAWGNFPNFSGANGSGSSATLNITKIQSFFKPLTEFNEKNYFRTISPATVGALWSGAFGEGGALPFESISYDFNFGRFHVGRSRDFADFDPKSVFVVSGGSYFGDWDSLGDNFQQGTQGKPSFLRAALGSPTFTLANMWVGRPHWFFHHMSLGETLGYATRVSQNNGIGGVLIYQAVDPAAAGWAHTALMGDPTLRTDIVRPPTLAAGGNTTLATKTLSWVHSPDYQTGSGPDPNFLGYYVYRGPTAAGPFTLRTASPITTTGFSEPRDASNPYYMVRACKREREMYDNLSVGIVTPNDGPVKYSVAGGPTSGGGWVGYPFLNGGGSQYVYTTTTAISTTGIQNPAPQAVYQSMSIDSPLTWTASYLQVGATYRVRAHFSSIPFYNQANVLANATVTDANSTYTVTGINPYAYGDYKALVVEFPQTFTPNSIGQISGTVVPGGAGKMNVLSGIEITPAQLPVVALELIDDKAVEGSAPSGPLDLGKFRISRTGSTVTPLKVTFSTANSTATGPSPSMDYTLAANGIWVSTSATIPIGSSFVDVDVHGWWDGYDENPDEYVRLTLTAPAGSPYTLTGTVSHDVTISP